jgi:hypothetical protein
MRGGRKSSYILDLISVVCVCVSRTRQRKQEIAGACTHISLPHTPLSLTNRAELGTTAFAASSLAFAVRTHGYLLRLKLRSADATLRSHTAHTHP